ncbi:hypothetical protein ACIRQP_34960 [Streptomyces sp. NPDC102274]|uniref:hypothetical protein n=1 Tax=Streptomyces sp. NPDC102274 TaxID=3366151 RepID=UPI0038270CBA
MSLADESGTDVEIYRRYGDDSVYLDTRTGAGKQLEGALDDLGATRHSNGPYVWRQLPVEGLTEEEIRQSATGALVFLAQAGYRCNLDPALFGQTTHDALLAHAADMREHYRQHPPPPRPNPLRQAVKPATPGGHGQPPSTTRSRTS